MQTLNLALLIASYILIVVGIRMIWSAHKRMKRIMKLTKYLIEHDPRYHKKQLDK
jgi:hypothetical protein